MAYIEFGRIFLAFIAVYRHSFLGVGLSVDSRANNYSGSEIANGYPRKQSGARKAVAVPAHLQENPAASIWFEIWGLVDPGKKNRFLQVILHTKIDFSRQISEKFRFFGQFHKKIQFPRQKLAIYSYFWANYSISLQKSPLSNILPVHDKI